jgi:hypothetical protein
MQKRQIVLAMISTELQLAEPLAKSYCIKSVCLEGGGAVITIA